MLQNSVATFCNGDPKIIRITKIPYILHLALEHLFPLHPKVLRHKPSLLNLSTGEPMGAQVLADRDKLG
jgi:hypothetical protein